MKVEVTQGDVHVESVSTWIDKPEAKHIRISTGEKRPRVLSGGHSRDHFNIFLVCDEGSDWPGSDPANPTIVRIYLDYTWLTSTVWDKHGPHVLAVKEEQDPKKIIESHQTVWEAEET